MLQSLMQQKRNAHTCTRMTISESKIYSKKIYKFKNIAKPSNALHGRVTRKYFQYKYINEKLSKAALKEQHKNTPHTHITSRWYGIAKPSKKS